jgi:hypothetical protein
MNNTDETRPPLSVRSQRPIDELRWQLSVAQNPGVAYSHRALGDLDETRVLSLAEAVGLI